jgi:hypothetical protein
MLVRCALLVFVQFGGGPGEDVGKEPSSDLWTDVAEEDLLVTPTRSHQSRVQTVWRVRCHDEKSAIYGRGAIKAVQQTRQRDSLLLSRCWFPITAHCSRYHVLTIQTGAVDVFQKEDRAFGDEVEQSHQGFVGQVVQVQHIQWQLVCRCQRD